MKNKMRPIHPGEVLREEFLVPLEMSANRLAQLLEVPANRITEIVGERRAITAETALRLSRAFDTTPEFLAEPPAGLRAPLRGEGAWPRVEVDLAVELGSAPRRHERA